MRENMELVELCGYLTAIAFAVKFIMLVWEYKIYLCIFLCLVIFAVAFVLVTDKKEGKKTMPKVRTEKPFEPLPMKELFEEYFSLSDVIKADKDFQRRLWACRRSYELLPYFVKGWLAENDELPPTIMCRDVGIKLFIRAGQWYSAECGIKKCIEAGVYLDGGQAALDYLNRYKVAAKSAVKFLLENPGYRQDNIYKALPHVDRDCLKDFIRSSLLIEKIKLTNTNLLYVDNKAYVQSDFLWNPEKSKALFD